MEIQNVINTITSAELEAEETIHIAALKAKDIQLETEVKCEKLKKDNIAETKKNVKLITSNAEIAANTKRDIKIKEGAKEVDKLIASAQGKINAASDYIIGRFTEQYVDC